MSPIISAVDLAQTAALLDHCAQLFRRGPEKVTIQEQISLAAKCTEASQVLKRPLREMVVQVMP